MKDNGFYKKGYLIAIYDENEQLQAICDNVEEFASVYKKSINAAKSIVSRISGGKQSTFLNYNEKLTVLLIPLDVAEIEELTKEKVTT
jgi:thymidine kinase